MRQGREMDTKFMISLLISPLLVATIYSSSISVVFADVSCIDAINTDKPTKFCVTDKSPDMYKCVQQDDGKWKCTKTPASANVPPGLTDALNDVTGSKVDLNDRGVLEDPTTLPKLEQHVGPNVGVLGNLQGNNMTFSELNSNQNNKSND
jgi:hypothetical protein